MKELEVEVVYSARKSICLQILRDGRIRVRAPYGTPKRIITAFLDSKRDWILRKRAGILSEAAGNAEPSECFSAQELTKLKNDAKADLPLRVKNWSAILGVTYGRVSVRAQKTRWGSCSSKGDLNFNCLLMLAPPEVRDYVVVHELCHRLEMNHSARFWALVEYALPDYKARRKWLKDNGGAMMVRLP